MEGARVHMRQLQVYQMSIINCLIRLMQQQDLELGAMLEQMKCTERLFMET